jgi:hypothetical protein
LTTNIFAEELICSVEVGLTPLIFYNVACVKKAPGSGCIENGGLQHDADSDMESDWIPAKKGNVNDFCVIWA